MSGNFILEIKKMLNLQSEISKVKKDNYHWSLRFDNQFENLIFWNKSYSVVINSEY